MRVQWNVALYNIISDERSLLVNLKDQWIIEFNRSKDKGGTESRSLIFVDEWDTYHR